MSVYIEHYTFLEYIKKHSEISIVVFVSGTINELPTIKSCLTVVGIRDGHIGQIYVENGVFGGLGLQDINKNTKLVINERRFK